MWKLAAPRLAKTHHVKFPGRRMRPVELMAPVVLEDVFAAAGRWLTALRDGYRRAHHEPVVVWTDRQLDAFPSLREAVGHLSPGVLNGSDAKWQRRLPHTAALLVAALLGWVTDETESEDVEKAARTVRRRLGDYMRLERADLRLAHCQECATAFYRRRSEPNAPNPFQLCRERERVAALC